MNEPNVPWSVVFSSIGSGAAMMFLWYITATGHFPGVLN